MNKLDQTDIMEIEREDGSIVYQGASNARGPDIIPMEIQMLLPNGGTSYAYDNFEWYYKYEEAV